MKKKANKGLISLIVILIVLKCFGPVLYINLMFWGSETIDSEVYSEDGESLSPILPYFGSKHMVYELYNAKEDIYFDFRFNKPWFSPFYIPESGDNYSAMLTLKNNRIQACAGIEKIINKYTDQGIIFHDPYNIPSYSLGCSIFTERLDENTLEELIDELNNYIDTKCRYPDRFYISCSLNICMDSDFFDGIQNADLSDDITGQIGFYTLISDASYEPVRITASDQGYSPKIYTAPDNRSDDEYQYLNSFEHLVFQYNSDPYMIADNKQQFYLFGLNKISDQ